MTDIATHNPGSDAAEEAFYAACHQHSIRTHKLVEEYEDLNRPNGAKWTASCLSRAMEDGEITPIECARLYPRATERELRLAQIDHELNLGALFALAFADEYTEGRRH